MKFSIHPPYEENLEISNPFTIFALMSEMVTTEMLLPKVRLSDREQKFCEAIANGHNGAESVRMAGYSVKDAATYGQVLRKKKKIIDEIMRLTAEREGYVKVGEREVLREFMHVVNADIKDFIDEDGLLFSPDHLKTLPSHKTKAIQSIKQTIDKGKVVTEVKLYDKLAALDKVARHVNFYKDDEAGNKQPVVNLVLPGALINLSGS